VINAGYLDIEIDQGSSFILDFELEDDDGNPVSLALATITGKIRKAPETADPAVATFTGTVISVDGEGRVSLTAVQTAAIPCDNSGQGKRKLTKYVYDVEVTYGDGLVQRVLEGICFVSPEVTK
jgi:hypothetical protein